MGAIGVTMPAFSVARHIGASIASVQAQTAPGWKLIVDDGIGHPRREAS